MNAPPLRLSPTSHMQWPADAAAACRKYTVSVNLWTTAPTAYIWAGDGGPYAPQTGTAGWLANFQVLMTQFGDMAAGAGAITGASEMALKLASGTSVFWDAQILTMPATFILSVVSQTLTLIPELLN